jgi:small redox-active disulfide protein 2
MKKVQILGTGCPKCRLLAEQAERAAQALKMDYTLEKITDIQEILKFGVMSTPVLAVDGKVLLAGKVPGTEALKKILAGVLNENSK